MTYDEFVAQIERGKVARIYLLLGSEAFLKQEATTMLLETILEPSSRAFNLDRFYGADADPAAVVNAALSFPVLAAKRLVILSDLGKVSERGLEVLLPLFEHPPDSTCLVLTAGKVDRRKKTFSILATHCQTVECTPLFDNQVPGWIRRRIERAGKEISREAADLLAVQVGTSLGELANEIEKLFNFVGDRARIEASDVGEVVGLSRVNTIFELTDAIGAEQISQAIRIVDRMLEEGEKTTGMVAMILRHLGILLRVKEYQKEGTPARELSQKLGISPYFVKGYVAQSRGFSLEMLTKGFEHLREADSDLKRGYQNDRTIMELLVYRLCASQAADPGSCVAMGG